MTRIRSLSLLLIAASAGFARDAVVLPAGTTVPIRFLERIRSGKDTVGAPVLVQTLGALEDQGCVVVPAYTRAAGRVTLSQRGDLFGGRGALGLRFDSLEVRRGEWRPIEAVLDSLEYTPSRDLTEGGTVYGSRGSIAKRAAMVGIMGAADIAAAPVALFGGYWIGRRGPPASIMAGEVGALRLTAPLHLGVGSRCADAGRVAPALLPDLPRFAPRTTTKTRQPGDPINLVLFGTAADLDSAFARAGWVGPVPGTIRTVTKEIVAGLANREVHGAPMGSQYFDGRRQDVAYELSGPNARYRHHVRMWHLDSLSTVWVGAANQDIGVKFNPFIGRFTHRIRPEVDDERDRIVVELEATGCADLIDFVPVPGAVTEGRNATGQRFVTDGRAALVLVRACDPVTDLLVDRPLD